MSIREAENEIRSAIDGLYGEREGRAISRWLLHFLKGKNFFIRADEHLTEKEVAFLKQAINRLKAGEPVQYITGESEFYGLVLEVTPDVLIPRPETEELVHLILKHVSNPSPVIWDIGTGSGAIALALQSALPEAKVYGSDFSETALRVARKNAEKLNLPVHFFRHDVLKEPGPVIPAPDFIVSNPPYIPRSEASTLSVHVREFEPESALFVPDDDPLLFYRRIAEIAKDLFRQKGMVFFEIHEELARHVESLLIEENFSRVKVYKDLQRKERMISAEFIRK